MSDTPIEEVTDAEAIQAVVTSRLIELHTAFPAKVDSFDASKQTVDVIPCLNRSLPDGQGNWTTEELPKLAAVPVCFPRCGSFFMSFPIQQGDYVLVVCAERNIGNWRSTGNQGDPGDLGMHTLDGAVAIPGVFPDSKALSSASASSMILGKDNTPASQIELDGSAVKLGGGSQFVALANKVATELGKIQTTLSTLTGATFGTPYTAGAVAASNVKAT